MSILKLLSKYLEPNPFKRKIQINQTVDSVAAKKLKSNIDTVELNLNNDLTNITQSDIQTLPIFVQNIQQFAHFLPNQQV